MIRFAPWGQHWGSRKQMVYYSIFQNNRYCAQRNCQQIVNLLILNFFINVGGLQFNSFIWPGDFDTWSTKDWIKAGLCRHLSRFHSSIPSFCISSAISTLPKKQLFSKQFVMWTWCWSWTLAAQNFVQRLVAENKPEWSAGCSILCAL